MIPDHIFEFRNPLTFAIENEHENVVYLLIEHGVDLEFSPEIINIDQPLIIAAQRRNLPIVRALLQKGCDLYIQENRGWSALDYAASKRLIYSKFSPVLAWISRAQNHHSRSPFTPATPQVFDILSNTGWIQIFPMSTEFSSLSSWKHDSGIWR